MRGGEQELKTGTVSHFSPGPGLAALPHFQTMSFTPRSRGWEREGRRAGGFNASDRDPGAATRATARQLPAKEKEGKCAQNPQLFQELGAVSRVRIFSTFNERAHSAGAMIERTRSVDLSV